MNGGHGSVLPPAYIPVCWADWDDHQKLMWVAHNIGSWQIKFFVSWLEFAPDKLWVKYDDFYANQVAGFTRILDFYGLPTPNLELMDQVTGCKSVNFNVGVMGRGSRLPDDVKAVLDAQARAWGRPIEKAIRGSLYA